jgi:hypothetical protein
LNRHPSTVRSADIAGYDSDPVFSHCQGPLCPGAGIAIPIDCHDTHSLCGKMADNFQPDTRGAAGNYRCTFQLSQPDTSSLKQILKTVSARKEFFATPAQISPFPCGSV